MKIKTGEYLTVKDMADILKLPANTVNQRLYQSGIKPISKDALYEVSALAVIKNTTMGRPKKTKTLDKEKPGKKSVKGK
jgi:predicted ArsR family transcriptional regulator